MDHLAFAATEGQPHMQYHYNGNHNFEEEDRDSEVDEKQSFGKMHDGDYGGDVSDERGEDDNNSPKKNLRRKMLQRANKDGEKIAQNKKPLKLQPYTKSKPARDQAKSTWQDLSQFILPQPKHDSVYSKSEAIAIIKTYKEKSRERGKAIQAMVQRGYVPNSAKSMYRLLYKVEQGIPINDEWNTKGRPSLTKQKHASQQSKPKPPRLAISIQLPKPMNGKIYSKTEAIAVVKPYKAETSERSGAIATIISKGYVPCTTKYLHELMQRDNEGLPIEDNHDWTKPLKSQAQLILPEPRDGNKYSDEKLEFNQRSECKQKSILMIIFVLQMYAAYHFDRF